MVLARARFSSIPVFMALALTALAISGCSTWTDVKRGLGMEKVVPDEFAVTTNAPLAIPPDYTLRPPKPGAAPTQQLSPTAQAQETVFRAGDAKLDTLPPDKSRSTGESALLQDAGAGRAPKDIRQLVNNEDQAAAGGSTLTQRLLFWQSPPPNPNQVVDPTAESERLHEFGANGGNGNGTTATGANAPATATAAAVTPKPTIERTPKSDKG